MCDARNFTRGSATEAAATLALVEEFRKEVRAIFGVCDDPRCEHPQGWHTHGVGACLECGCLGFKDPRT